MTARLFLHELRAQQLLFWRNREAAFFTFFLPILFLLLLGSVYGDEDIEGIRAARYLVAGLASYGIASTAFAGLAISLVVRRESGVLKRVRGTPLPPHVYLAAVIASTLLVVAIEVAAQVAIGRYVFDAGWPKAPGSFAAASLVGTACFAALGLGLTGIVRSAEGSSAVVNAIYLPMTFISGVFFSVESMPGFLQAIADVLPLTYLLRMIRDAFVSGDGLGAEPLAVLAVWGAGGLAAALLMFRWEPREA